jgi:hypothetical protein
MNELLSITRCPWTVSRLRPFLALALAGLSACGGPNNGEEINKLRTRLDSLESRVRMTELVQDLQRDEGRAAYLTPGSDGYTAVRMDIGVVTVSVADIEPYANGSRVRLKFGNTTAATIDGAKMTIEYGPIDAKGYPINESTKTRDASFTESLPPGSWKTVPVILEGVPPTALGFIRVQNLTNTGIHLYVR